MKKKYLDKYGPWALVTGASEGIGRAVAENLAAKGLNLIVIARRKVLLDQLAAELMEKHNVKVIVLALDLSSESALEQIESFTSDLDIGLLVAAAGYGTSGYFSDMDINKELNMVDINCRSVTQLCHQFIGRFKQRQRGGIILFSSIFAFQGVPRSASYAATKGYIQCFAEALHAELKTSNIDILSAAYGPVKTGFAERADMKMAFSQSPQSVATATVEALGKKVTVRPGALSKLLGYSLACLPRQLRTKVLGLVVADMTRHQFSH